MRYCIEVGLTLVVLASATASAQSITNASPSSVLMQAGGAAVTLTLDGQQLSALTSVRALLSGQPVSGLKGVLGTVQPTATGGNRMNVALTADRSVVAGKYQLELLAGTQRVTTAVSITVTNPLPQPIDQTSSVLPLQQPKVAGTVSMPTATVTSAAPVSVALRAGGPAQTVVLNGSLLNQITGVYAERSGTRIYGIRTELVPSSDAARREVRVSALANAGPPWGVPTALVLETKIGTPAIMPVAVRTPVLITAAAPPNVDLVVSSCRIEGNVARATIRNNGSEGASFPAGKPIITWNPEPDASNQTLAAGPFVAPGGGHYIAAGATRDFQITFTFATGTLTEVLWKVDPSDAVEESNAANNERTCRSASATTAPANPITDLAISAISTQPTIGPPQTAFEFTVVIKNVGTVSQAAYNQSTTCLIDNGTFPGSSFYVTRALAANETFTQVIKTSGNFNPGTHVLECTVDYSNKLTESTRNNNARSLVFTVTK